MSRKTTIKLRWKIMKDGENSFVSEFANDVEIAVYGPMNIAWAKEFRRQRQHVMEQAIMNCARRELFEEAELKRRWERGLSCSGQSWAERLSEWPG